MGEGGGEELEEGADRLMTRRRSAGRRRGGRSARPSNWRRRRGLIVMWVLKRGIRTLTYYWCILYVHVYFSSTHSIHSA